MDLQELQAALVNLNVPPDAYCLAGGLPVEAYCIEEKAGKWRVYYSQRGARERLKTFDTEEEACGFFLSWITPEFRKTQ
jgi:hypothetical protein